jgi:hypothetical protein
MKKPTLLAVIALLTLLPLGVQAQEAGAAPDRDPGAPKSSTKPTNLAGEIGGDGKTLTADRDRRIWKVTNPEILRGIDTRHVRVRARVDAIHGQIHILSVSAISDERAGVKLDDAAFRR